MAFDYECRGPLARRSMGRTAGRTLTYTVLYLPDDLERTLEFGRGSRLRIEGEIEGVPVALALQPGKRENHYVLVSRDLMRRIDRDVGDMVTLSFNIADASIVAVPKELAEALAVDEDARLQWDELTPGRQRSWASFVDRAKLPKTRRSKVEEVVDRMRRGLIDPRDRWPSVE